MTIGMAAAVCVSMTALVAPDVASASIYSDDLGKCLVAKTTDEDKSKLIQWVFAALSVNPEVKKMTAITQDQRDALDRSTAAMFSRLLFSDCRAASVAALKYDGSGSLTNAFGLLGQVAMKSLTDTPAVNDSFGKFTTYVDAAKMQALAAEAGIPNQKKPAASK